MNLKRSNVMKEFYTERTRWIIKGGIWDTQAQINYINGILSTDVQLKPSFNNMVWQNLLVLVVLVSFCIIIYCSYNILLKQWVWYAVACFIYMHGCGGIWYAIHNRVPIFRFDVDDMGKIFIGEYFNRSNN